MHPKLCLLTFLTLLSLIVTRTAQAQQNQRFSGTWRAKVQDSVICTIQLRTDAGISGSMKDCHVNTDADGNLIEPEPSETPSKPTPISNARITGEMLSFDCRDADETEPIRFEMTLVREDVADLVIKNAPVRIKPIRFVRTSSTK